MDFLQALRSRGSNLSPTHTHVKQHDFHAEYTEKRRRETQGLPPFPKEDMHGFRFKNRRDFEDPTLVVSCYDDARPGYDTVAAHEYLDTPATLRLKCKALLGLFGEAKGRSVVYAGAGLSTSSGIGDYASRATNSLSQTDKRLRSPYLAQPTLCHHAIVGLAQRGLVDHFIQQNHDGLPQKAGFPQEMMNEIHGAWYDPSNPVVPMDGDLRTDLFENLLEWENRASLVLALGTSMCGMNADRVALTPARKALASQEGAVGMVMVGLQRTQHDAKSTLRIYATLDNFAATLADELGMMLPQVKRVAVRMTDEEVNAAGFIFQLPYDAQTGMRRSRQGQENTNGMTLDLRQGAHVRLTSGPYAGDVGEIVGCNFEGHFKIRFWHHCRKGNKKSLKAPMVRVLGRWWLSMQTLPQFPIVQAN